VSYPERGPWGDPKFRGNTTGYLIRDLIELYRPKSVLDPMEGSGTARDVCKELGIEYDGFDLSRGFDLFSSPLPCKRYDMIFWHPPYMDIIKYSDDPRDMSNISRFDEFMQKLFEGLNRLSEYLTEDGVLVLQIGDVRRQGEYYPLGAYVQVFRRKELKAKLIKVQHNVASSNKTYGGAFIPIMHEEVLVLKGARHLTWRELVLRTLKELGGEATLGELYAAIANHPKRLSNPTYPATVRRTLQESAEPVRRGLWRWLGGENSTE
jgi:hypothetical protein